MQFAPSLGFEREKIPKTFSIHIVRESNYQEREATRKRDRASPQQRRCE